MWLSWEGSFEVRRF